jgi:hypothetical protein
LNFDHFRRNRWWYFIDVFLFFEEFLICIIKNTLKNIILIINLINQRLEVAWYILSSGYCLQKIVIKELENFFTLLIFFLILFTSSLSIVSWKANLSIKRISAFWSFGLSSDPYLWKVSIISWYNLCIW